jgi:hypothetical protein
MVLAASLWEFKCLQVYDFFFFYLVLSFETSVFSLLGSFCSYLYSKSNYSIIFGAILSLLI